MKIYKLSAKRFQEFNTIAYHGSKSRFDSFSTDFVGGEFVQEGPGIYLTSSKDDARRYSRWGGAIILDGAVQFIRLRFFQTR